jgi:hypothetical protein
MEQSVACHVSSWLAGGVHTKPNTAGPNGNEFELEVRRGWRFWSHFAGGAGAVAILSAMEDADAALVMASADATGRTKREKIIKANPFLEGFTIADLRNWADRKMRVVPPPVACLANHFHHQTIRSFDSASRTPITLTIARRLPTR